MARYCEVGWEPDGALGQLAPNQPAPTAGGLGMAPDSRQSIGNPTCVACPHKHVPHLGCDKDLLESDDVGVAQLAVVDDLASHISLVEPAAQLQKLDRHLLP